MCVGLWELQMFAVASGLLSFLLNLMVLMKAEQLYVDNWIKGVFFPQIHTVHLDIIKVLFIH